MTTASPCIGHCKLSNQVCLGCQRTITEIAQWRAMSEDQRSYTVKSVTRQLTTHACPTCSKPTQCDIKAGKSSCWCFDLPKATIDTQMQISACRCRECLSTNN